MADGQLLHSMTEEFWLLLGWFGGGLHLAAKAS
jgi:hypothetical protein